MSFVYPYQYEQVDNLLIPYPVVPVTLNTIRGPRAYSFIVDTGADTTTMPRFMLVLLGLQPSRLKSSVSQGIGKNIVKTREAIVTIMIHGERLQAPCSFTDNDHTPFLLGKVGIFDAFNIQFNNDKHQVEFERRLVYEYVTNLKR